MYSRAIEFPSNVYPILPDVLFFNFSTVPRLLIYCPVEDNATLPIVWYCTSVEALSTTQTEQTDHWQNTCKQNMIWCAFHILPQDLNIAFLNLALPSDVYHLKADFRILIVFLLNQNVSHQVVICNVDLFVVVERVCRSQEMCFSVAYLVCLMSFTLLSVRLICMSCRADRLSAGHFGLLFDVIVFPAVHWALWGPTFTLVSSLNPMWSSLSLRGWKAGETLRKICSTSYGYPHLLIRVLLRKRLDLDLERGCWMCISVWILHSSGWLGC